MAVDSEGEPEAAGAVRCSRAAVVPAPPVCTW